ncbi:MAG: hypothetical protein AAF530_18260 [Pseudomonadota bacterium]
MTIVSRTAYLPVPVTPHALTGPRAKADPTRLEPVRPVPAIEAQPPSSQNPRPAQQNVQDRGKAEARQDFTRQGLEPNPREIRNGRGGFTGSASQTATGTNSSTAFYLHQLGEEGSGQNTEDAGLGRAQLSVVLAKHRDGLALGSGFYRRAGGEPEIFSEGPTLLRLAI